MRKALFAALLCLAAARAHADTITLKDGTVVEGAIVEENDVSIVVKLKFGKVTYKRDEIKEIVRAAAVSNPGDLRDVIKLRNGETQHGLIVSENEKEVTVDLVMSGKTVTKTMFARMTYRRGEIDEIKAITPEQRAAVRAYFERTESQAKEDTLNEQMIQIQPHQWPSKDPEKKIPCKKVELENFTIESNTSDEFLRKVAFRLGKVFGAYRQHFGIERNQDVKVRVVIFNSMAEYQAAIGGQIMNPAFYAPDLKLISAGCDVAQYEDMIKEIRAHYARLDRELEEWKKKIDAARADIQGQVSRYYEAANRGGKGITPQDKALLDAIQGEKTRLQLYLGQLEKHANEVQDQIFALNRRNDIVFQQATGAMFATLYHEGFHAFLDNYLFPDDLRKSVPLWLNEGLAQYFEAARIENNRFILGQEDRAKMAMLRTWNKANELVPLASLAVAESKEFLVKDLSNVENSTKHYLQAWALTHLLGEAGRLNMPTLRGYVQALKDGKPPLHALPLLTGMSNEQLQTKWEEKLKYAHERNAPPAAP
ncbi:MAG: DUF1570 domain-containing protein [Planctomycetota bacterium]|nr:DUF1570 domain-containing protein [Planctomycetota bacterium]